MDWSHTSTDHDLAAVVRDKNRKSPPPVFAIFCSKLRTHVGESRYRRIVRLAGLGYYLDIPYTPTGAEMIGTDEEQNVLEVLRSRRLWRYELSSSDSMVARFEEEAEQLLGVKHVHATVSGSIALQVALLALGVGPGDEVIIPTLTWVGCADAVILCGAVPVLAQVDETLSIAPADVKQKLTSRTKAIMAVSVYGNPCAIDVLAKIAGDHRIVLVEDNCQADGVSYRGKRLGGFGAAAAFSMNLMKFISSGDGGFIATNRDDVYEFAVMFTGGKAFPSRKRHLHLSAPTIPFTTLRMNEVTGAVALAQLRRLDWLLGRLRTARQQIFMKAGTGRSFTRVLGNDPAGDAGWCSPLLFNSADQCGAFVAAVRRQGIYHVTTWKESFAGGEIHHCYPALANESLIPKAGGHWATHFHAMVEKKSIDSRVNPWTHPLYSGAVDYSAESMAPSASVVERIAMLQTNPRLEPEDCACIADAIRRADDEVADNDALARPAALTGPLSAASLNVRTGPRRHVDIGN